ncbi:hypothetical protein FQN50_002524 [Emmonsiellopsis sp. PD_5]|nr:hypothetical protein FQN50_002524 [Emmonsiellopsis sp. PD_5]
MAPIQYIPFKEPRKVGWVLTDLFNLYWACETDSFLFERLQNTTSLEVRCKDATGEKIKFTTSASLLKAIHESPRICSPDKAFRGLPTDFGFTGFMFTAVSEVGDKINITKPELFHGPFLDILNAGIVVDYHRRILGDRFFQHSPNHWLCTLRDHSSPHDPRQAEEDRRDYFLKSELMGITAMMYRQMNEMVWIPKEDDHRARMRYKEGLLTVTTVTFIPRKVRVVQATCRPSDPLPTLSLTLRAIYTLAADTFYKNTAFEVLQWILSPPDAPPPAKELEMAIRSKKLAC